jgi:beta-lactamase superfamily II metal-dependent hydrolase
LARERNRKLIGNGKLRLTVFVLVAALTGLCALYSYNDKNGGVSGGNPLAALEELLSPGAEAIPAIGGAVEAGVEVHFLDVGQGKSILIQAGGENALIDVGENGYGNTVITYLREQGVEAIDLLIGTHPHSDHIGDIDEVIAAFDIGEVVLPDVPEDISPTSRTYMAMLEAIDAKGLSITAANPGDRFELGGARLTVLGPVEAYDDLNNISVVTRLDYGGTSFLFAADMERKAEEDLLESRADLDADVLDVGHHGSETSSGEEFLAEVTPDIAVISCGIDNSYNHPHREAVERVEAAGAEVYRTDLDGAVVVSSNGEEISVRTEK